MDYPDKYIGQILDNRYEILEKIGSGGMAVVYKARCHRLNRLVAVKILKEELAGDADFRRRFRTESQAVAMLSHPNIVAVYDVSRSGNVEYIVMELIEGITLKQYISRKGMLNWKEALHFSTQVAKALSHAHSKGIIHRDIKPHNIMILKDGSVKVADFGIARLQSSQNTLTQEALGSVHYISPEQAKGGPVDARSDIYSLGVVMYEMLTSRLPFEGDSAVSIAIQHISAVPLMPREINPEVPEGLESITMHAMEPDLGLRYATADEMLRDLEEFRKNPAIRFDYSARGASARRLSPGDQATLKVPSEAILRADGVLAKPVRTPARRIEAPPEEERKSVRKASKTSTLVGVFVVIVFLAAVFVFMYVNFIGPWLKPNEETVTIPKFVGQKYEDIAANPDYAGLFNFTVTEEYSDAAEAGVVISQNPTADREVRKRANNLIDVELVVSKGKEPPVTMPDLVNIDYREAVIRLNNLNLDLKVETSWENSSDVTKDYVIRTIPQAGEPLVKGGTVYVIYSAGPEVKKTIVPNVQGMSLTAAQYRLEGYNLKWEVKYVEDPIVPKDYVISQDLIPDTEVEEGTVVVLIVSKGPPASASPSPTTTSPPPTDETPGSSPESPALP